MKGEGDGRGTSMGSGSGVKGEGDGRGTMYMCIYSRLLRFTDMLY